MDRSVARCRHLLLHKSGYSTRQYHYHDFVILPIYFGELSVATEIRHAGEVVLHLSLLKVFAKQTEKIFCAMRCELVLVDSTTRTSVEPNRCNLHNGYSVSLYI